MLLIELQHTCVIYSEEFDFDEFVKNVNLKQVRNSPTPSAQDLCVISSQK